MKKIRPFSKAVSWFLSLLLLSCVLQAAEPVTVIVPYNPGKPVAEQKPDQFYLPYERFLELWERAKENRKPPAAAPASVAFSLNSARYEGHLGERFASFRGMLDLSVTGEAWTAVPLPFTKALVRRVAIDGVPAAFDGEKIVIEKPGRHRIEVEFEVPRTDNQLFWNIPRSTATLVTITLPNARTTAAIVPGSGVIERLTNGVKTVTAALGATEEVRVELGLGAASERVIEPAVAAIQSELTVSRSSESIRAAYEFSFPQARQDRFSVRFEKGLTLTDLEAPNLKSWKLRDEGESQVLDLFLNAPVTDTYALSLTAERPLGGLPLDLRAPAFSAAANRVETTLQLLANGRVEITPQPGAGLRQVPGNAPLDKRRLVAAYAGSGELGYRVALPAPMREARIDYVYQVNRRKIELIASVQFVPNGEEISEVTVGLPAQFGVEAVNSGAVKTWWREGDQLHLRFTGPLSEEIPVVIYLVRLFDQAQSALEVRPLALTGFKNVTGGAVIAAHKSVEAGMQVSGDGREVAPELAATRFQILAPLERKRGFHFRTQDFSAQVSLTALPAKADALWVMSAQAHETWVALNTKVRLSLRQGSVDRTQFTLPAALPEARVSGEDVRETRTRIEGALRIYEVRFQREVDEMVDFSFELELVNPGEVVLPSLAFPEARAVSGYVIADNASDSEMKLQSSGVDPAPASEIPWLPSLSRAAGILRVQPNWSITLGVDRLEKAASRAAFCAWAEITSALRGNGSEWHRVTWRLQNRSLQFLPVRLPEGAELMSARVAGKSVRADAGKVEGNDAILIPLIKTRPGDLSYDVELVYRRNADPLAWQTRRAWQEPHLVGITVERTFWHLWLPDDRQLGRFAGNMEAVIGEMAEAEKLTGALDELKKLSSLVVADNVSEETRANARSNWSVLCETIGMSSKVSTGRSYSTVEEKSSLSAKSQTLQNKEVLDRKREISSQLDAEAKRLAEQDQAAVAKGGSSNKPRPAGAVAKPSRQFPGLANAEPAADSTFWDINGDFAGNKATAGSSPGAPKPAEIPAGGGDLGLNDNVILQQRQAPSFSQEFTNIQGIDANGVAPGQNYTALGNARGNRRQVEQLAEKMEQTKPAPVPSPGSSLFSMAAAAASDASGRLSGKQEDDASRSNGRISLAVDFPTEGTVYHFKKIKANAVLEVSVIRSQLFERWKPAALFVVLAGCLLGLRFAIERRRKARLIAS